MGLLDKLITRSKDRKDHRALRDKLMVARTLFRKDAYRIKRAEEPGFIRYSYILQEVDGKYSEGHYKTMTTNPRKVANEILEFCELEREQVASMKIEKGNVLTSYSTAP